MFPLLREKNWLVDFIVGCSQMYFLFAFSADVIKIYLVFVMRSKW